MIATAAAVINVILVKESPASVLEDLRVIALTRDRPFKSLKKYLDATNDQKRDQELRDDEKSGKTSSSSLFLLLLTMAGPTYLCPCQIRIFITGIHSVGIFRSSETDNAIFARPSKTFSAYRWYDGTIRWRIERDLFSLGNSRVKGNEAKSRKAKRSVLRLTSGIYLNWSDRGLKNVRVWKLIESDVRKRERYASLMDAQDWKLGAKWHMRSV